MSGPPTLRKPTSHTCIHTDGQFSVTNWPIRTVGGNPWDRTCKLHTEAIFEPTTSLWSGCTNHYITMQQCGYSLMVNPHGPAASTYTRVSQISVVTMWVLWRVRFQLFMRNCVNVTSWSSQTVCFQIGRRPKVTSSWKYSWRNANGGLRLIPTLKMVKRADDMQSNVTTKYISSW